MSAERPLPRKFNDPRLESLWDSVFASVYASQFASEMAADRQLSLDRPAEWPQSTPADLLRDCAGIEDIAVLAADIAVKKLINRSDYTEVDRWWIECDHYTPFK